MKIKRFIAILIVLGAVFLLSCSSSDPEGDLVVVFEGNEYVVADYSWTPIGELLDEKQPAYSEFYETGTAYNTADYEENAEIQRYANDESNVFILKVGTLLTDDEIYIRKGVEYPNPDSDSLVTQIILENQDERVLSISQKTQDELLRTIGELEKVILANLPGPKPEWEIAERKNGPPMWLSIYYSDFPAYYTSWSLAYTKDGQIGIEASDSAKNNLLFGDASSLLILSNEAITEIRKLDKGD